MSNNTFDIEVGAFIPTEMTPGKIYINALRYTNKVPYGDNGSFLLVSKPKSYLGAGVTKEIVACVSNENRVDSVKIYVTPGHPGYTIAEPLDPTRYYLDSNKNILFEKVAKLFILLLSICICSFILCKEINTKGYIGGCIYSLIFIIPFILISLINSSFKLRLILYYLMIFLSSCVGGIFSKQTKKNNK